MADRTIVVLLGLVVVIGVGLRALDLVSALSVLVSAVIWFAYTGLWLSNRSSNEE